MKRHIGHRILTIAIILIAAATAAVARIYEPQEVKNPNLADRREYVADPEGRLGRQTRASVNRRLQALRDSTSAEVAVAVVPSIGDHPIEDFAEKVFTAWGLGKKDRDNGVLLLISPDSRQVRIQTGYGTEGALPDITCRRIIDKAVIPNMREDCLDCAVEEATAMIADVLTDPEYAEELRSKEPDNYGRPAESPVTSADFMWFLGTAIFCVWMLALINYILDVRKTRRMKDSAGRALRWKNSLRTYLLTGFLSALTAMPFYLLARRNYRKARYGERPCRRCGGKTVLLTGKEASAFLSPSQQCEARLGSVEYDVRRCERCGDTEVTAFPTSDTKYSACPRCGTRAYHYIGRRVMRQPTYTSEGYGERQYRCEYCGHRDDKGFRIPKKDMAAAVAAASALGAASRRRGGGGFGGGSFGGGSFGGGFGGGSTGGGGASGRW